VPAVGVNLTTVSWQTCKMGKETAREQSADFLIAWRRLCERKIELEKVTAPAVYPTTVFSQTCRTGKGNRGKTRRKVSDRMMARAREKDSSGEKQIILGDAGVVVNLGAAISHAKKKRSHRSRIPKQFRSCRKRDSSNFACKKNQEPKVRMVLYHS
jgi:hypothetical protein